MMLGLALRSIRRRASAFAATFMGAFLGSVIVMTFASLLDTARTPGLPSTDRHTMLIMTAVVGGIGAVIVAFSVGTTLILTVRQRSSEIALLKSVGATPAQLRRMIVGEALVLTVAAAALAVPVAMLTGRALLHRLIAADLVTAGTGFRFGAAALVIGAGIPLLASVVAAAFAAQRTAGMRVTESLVDAAVDNPPMSRLRLVIGWVFVAGAVNCAIMTATMFAHSDAGTLQSVGAEGCVLSAVGFALLAPVLARWVIDRVAGAVQRIAGTSGYLTVLNVRQRTQQTAGALIPIILLTGMSVGTLYMESIESSAASAGAATDKGTEALNYVVVGMICVFAAIMTVNSLIAATTYRRREFGQQRLIGSTPRQVLGMVGTEGAVLAGTGLLFGTVSGLLTAIPYSIARVHRVIPDSTAGIYLGVVGGVIVLTLGAGLGAARYVLRTPATQAAVA